MQLREATLVLFGNPAAGTPVMVAAPKAGRHRSAHGRTDRAVTPRGPGGSRGVNHGPFGQKVLAGRLADQEFGDPGGPEHRSSAARRVSAQ